MHLVSTVSLRIRPGHTAGEYFILRAHLAGVLQQVNQDFEGFALEFGIHAVDEQLQSPFIENRAGKVPTAAASISIRSGAALGLSPITPYVLVA